MSTHHAQLYIAASTAELTELLRVLSVESEVVLYELPTLTISEVRDLIISAAYQKPLTLKTRTIVVVTTRINREAQHALLKILEEPPTTTKFIFWLPSGAVLLPTILSRVQLMSVPENISNKEYPYYQSFLTSPVATRFELIASLTKKKDLNNLLQLSKGMRQHLSTLSSLDVVVRPQLLWCLSLLEVNGASKKMLWEEMALLLPVEAREEK